jgi:hypothetical protein
MNEEESSDKGQTAVFSSVRPTPRGELDSIQPKVAFFSRLTRRGLSGSLTATKRIALPMESATVQGFELSG